jgi:hypothetical protein
MYRIGILLLIAVFYSCSAGCQEFIYKAELFSGGSVSVFNEPEGLEPPYSVGSFDFGVGGRLHKRFGAEFLGRRIHLDNNKVSYPFESTVWLFGGNLLYHFSDSKVQPYIFGGGAFLDYHRTSGAPSLPGEFITDENSFAFNFGGGARAFLSRNIALRPQVSFLYDTNLNEHNDRHGYLLSFSAALAFVW